jgi:hypothetical protein
MAVISKGIKLSYKKDSDFVELTNLQEIPELGGDSEAIEITTLADPAHMYTDGILNYGDSVAFKFLYEKEQFTTLSTIGAAEWKVELPDGATCTFPGSGTVKLDGAGVNVALTYTLAVKPTGAMLWA